MRYFLPLVLVAGLILGLSGARSSTAFFGWVLVATAVGSLVTAVVLACGGVVPAWCGRSAVGQALVSDGTLVMGLMKLVGDSIPPTVGWTAAAISVTAFLAGLCVESRAHRLAQAAMSTPASERP